jgi:NifU-like protein involved in Fe-S cluster formation
MTNELYGQAIKDLAGKEGAALDHADARISLDNPLCGDRVALEISLKEGRVGAVGYQVKGCLLCKAASALVAEHAVGLDADEAARLMDQVSAMLKKGEEPGFPSLAVFLPVRPHKSRHGCVLLPFKALARAIRP